MTAAGLVRLCLMGFAIAVSLLALDFAKQALEEAFSDFGPAAWRMGLEAITAVALSVVAAMAFYPPRRLIAAFTPPGDSLDLGGDYVRWKTVVMMLAGGLVALPALDHLVRAVVNGKALDTAQALVEISLALVLVVGPGACGRLMFRFVAHR